MIGKLSLLLFLGSFYACTQKQESSFSKREFYVKTDTVNINNFKFSKKEFNSIVNNFPSLYQDAVIHPDSLFNSEFTNQNFAETFGQSRSISLDEGKSCFLAVYAYFLARKNKNTRFAYLKNHLEDSYEAINSIFGKLNRDSTYFIQQHGRIPTYVEYDIYFINNSERLPIFTKATRSERWEFIEDFKHQISIRSKTAGKMSGEETKIDILVNKLNESIVNDYVLYKAKIFIKPYLQNF